MKLLTKFGLQLSLMVLTSALAFGQGFGVKSAGSVQKVGGAMQVVVVFNDKVDPVTATATANYTIPGATVSAATVITGLPSPTEPYLQDNPTGNPSGRVFDNEAVLLTVTGLPATATSITVRNVKNATGTTMADRTLNFTPSGYSWSETGTLGTREPGVVIPIDDDGFDVFSSGDTQWADYDETTFVHKQVTGDFDYKARLEFQDTSSVWARAGIMVRETLDVGKTNPADDETNPALIFSRYMGAHANPVRSYAEAAGATGFRAGNNQFESHYRPRPGAQTASASGGAPQYPNAWLRVTRVGQIFTSFRSDDGATWEQIAERDFSAEADGTPMPDTVYVGPSYSPETGNIAETAQRAKLYLMQIRFNALTLPILRSFRGGPGGFSALIEDAVTAVNTNTIQVTFDGTVVVANISKNGTNTIIEYVSPTILPAGSSHRVDIRFSDNGTPVSTQVATRNFIVSNYSVLTAADAAPVGAVNTGQSGFSFRPHVISSPDRPANIAAAETQLAGLFPTAETPSANEADLTGADSEGYIIDPDIINWSEDAGIGEATTERGNFTALNGYPDELIPAAASDNNLAYEIIAYLDLKKGAYTMGVNSDDGFKVTAGPMAKDAFATRLGFFDAGRGASDTLFDFVVDQDGIYPFRLLWFEGGGDASVEWFMVTSTGQKILLNDRAVAGHVKTYPKGTAAQAYLAHVRVAYPHPGATAVPSDATLRFEIVDARTQVNSASVQLKLDGQDVTETVSKVGGVTTVTYNPPENLPGGSHSYTLIFSDGTTTRTNQGTAIFNYLTGPVFFIEVEDFNHSGGQYLTAADAWDYPGGAYDGLSAVSDIDFHDSGNPDAASMVYRMDEVGNVGMATDGDADRGNFQATITYKIGWTDAAGDWYNYTRNFSNGVYKVVARLSHGGSTATDIMGGELSLLTSSPAQGNQTLQSLGTFRAPASGGWSLWDFVPLKDSSGNDALVRLNGTQTLRYSVRFNGGDINYLAFLPQPNVILRPVVSSTSPLNNGAAIREHDVTITLSDRDSRVVPASIQVFLNGTQVSNPTITDTASGATVRFTPPPAATDAINTVRIVFGDDGSPAQTQEHTFSYRVSAISTANYFIEAEDFNYDSGQWKPGTAKGQYNGLSAVLGVDYNDSGNPDVQSDIYRTNEVNNVGMAIVNDIADGARPGFETVSDYKIGWTSPGDWYNYTRDFPVGQYNVYGRMSRDDDVAGVTLGGYLDLVTPAATNETQTLTRLGTFNAPPTGSWDVYQLIPMKNANGDLSIVNLGGVQTLRYTVGFDGGDISYLMFVPADHGDDFPELTIARQGGQTTISWTNGGTLQSSEQLGTGANWQAVPGASAAGTPIQAIGNHRFYRVVK
ncbi:MAG TPA: hypothetical protein VF773_11670 [Verrucomicrobiae bacterium]